MYTIEFQKRDLPHVHILLFLDPKNKCTTLTHIDSINVQRIFQKSFYAKTMVDDDGFQVIEKK